MKPDQRLWTRDELILAFNLYCQLPFGKLDQNTGEVKELGLLIERTPGAVSYKLNNLASLDPSLKARGIKGAENGSKLDKQVWAEFIGNREELIFESVALKARLNNVSIESTLEITDYSTPELLIFKEGKTREALVKLRGKNGKYLIAAGQNRGPLKIFELKKNINTIPIQANEVNAR